MRSVPLGLALLALAAGCLAGPGEPVDRAGVTLPPWTDAPPAEADEGGECGELTLDASQATLRPGEETTFRTVLRNCGTVPLERATPCTAPLWEPRFVLEGVEFHVLRGAAVNGFSCLTAIGHWRVEPGAAMEENWTWDGTLEECRSACVTRDAPPGRYELTSVLPKRDAMTQEGEGAWTAGVVVEVLARG